MKLPNYNKAIIDLKKLEEYCLNPHHPTGKHKAKVFKSVLGITKSDSVYLKNKMLEALKINEATFISEDKFGKRFFVDFELTYNKKNTYVRTIWILKLEEEYPRLVTCYIK